MKKKLQNSGYNVLNLTMTGSFLIFNLLGYCAINLKQLNMLDNKILINIHHYAAAHSLIIPILITDLGDIYYLLFLFLVATAVLSFNKLYGEAIKLTVITGTGATAVVFIKHIFYRLRPETEYRLINVEGSSFPSGHSFIAMCFYGTLIYFIFKNVKSKKKKYLSTALLSTLILLIGFSRIYLGVHYFSDVLGGFSLGIFWICLWLNIISFAEKHKKSSK